ncbi:MAG: nucleotidyltransferase [Polyangiaceae bacterium]|nr:nucleotidyltransferase [Polyangiaceae bacterium]
MLCAHRVRFLIVGGHAFGVIGRIRTTKDLDLLVEPTIINAKRVCAALAEFGFEALARCSKEFTKPERMAILGREPLRIDLMTSITGVTFARAWRGRTKATLGGHEVGVLGRDEFIANKLATARPQDLADVAVIEEMEKISISRCHGSGSRRQRG